MHPWPHCELEKELGGPMPAAGAAGQGVLLVFWGGPVHS
jgi:hypothetical protein